MSENNVKTEMCNLIARLVEEIVKGAEVGSVHLDRITKDGKTYIMAYKSTPLGTLSFSKEGHLINVIDAHLKTYDLSVYLGDGGFSKYYEALLDALHKQDEKTKKVEAERDLRDLSDILNRFSQ